MKYFKFICLIILSCIRVNSFSQNHFTTYNDITNVAQTKYIFHKSDSIPLLKNKSPISGYSITGHVELKSRNSLVRVVLGDRNNEEYLVYETYPLISELGISQFNNICEETSLLDNIVPAYLKVIVEDAMLQIDTIQTSGIVNQTERSRVAKQDLSLNQAIEKARMINQNHAKNGGSWYAGVTNMALLPYKTKKALFGGDNYNTNGFEYYVSGFFVDEPDAEDNIENKAYESTNASPYPSEFDWRNRHGIDWTTSIKNQGDGGGCWAFTAVGAVEIMANLYFNRKLDLDLSEQDLISCSGAGNNVLTRGGWPAPALDYISREGVVNEECFPFADADLPCSQKCSSPSERIKIGGYTEIPTIVNNRLVITEDALKENIIFKGPLTSGYRTQWCHAMALVGYGTIKEGDFIYKDTENWEGTGLVVTIQAGNPLIGRTYWIFKNSYGIGTGTENGTTHNVPGTGYIYMVFKSLSHILEENCSITLPITSLNYTEADRVCEDKDGDGYFYWGIGQKPSTCPACAPDEPDGDDSDPTLGPMDQYGNCIPITPLNITENITTNKIWNTQMIPCGNIIVKSGATLTINTSGKVKLQPRKSIIIESGGKLILSGGTIENANISVKPGGNLTISNNGKLYLNSNDNLEIEIGATFDFGTGEVITNK